MSELTTPPETKEDAILREFQTTKYLSLDKAVELIGNQYDEVYRRKDVGVVLSKMIHAGQLRRVKNGVFALPNKTASP